MILLHTSWRLNKWPLLLHILWQLLKAPSLTILVKVRGRGGLAAGARLFDSCLVFREPWENGRSIKHIQKKFKTRIKLAELQPTFALSKWISCSNFPKDSSVNTSKDLFIRKASIRRSRTSIARECFSHSSRPIEKNTSSVRYSEVVQAHISVLEIIVTFLDYRIRRFLHVSTVHSIFYIDGRRRSVHVCRIRSYKLLLPAYFNVSSKVTKSYLTVDS